MRRRLAELKARYEASRRREADLKGQLETADLDLQIQTGERRVLDLRKAEAEREAARAATGRDAAQKEAERAGATSRRAWQRFTVSGRLGYLRPLAAADSATSFLSGLRLLTHLARRDAALLVRHEEAAATLAAREEELAARGRSSRTSPPRAGGRRRPSRPRARARRRSSRRCTRSRASRRSRSRR